MSDTDAAARAFAAAKVEIRRAIAARETELDFNRERFKALSELPATIARFTKLKKFNVSNTQLADISPLAEITQLQTLDLDNTEVTDITPLAGSTRLRNLSLNNTNIADIGPLAGIAGLLRLSISNTQVVDIAPLAGITELRNLDLGNTQVIDIAPLAGMTRLLTLSLFSTQVADIAPLAGITGLQGLSINRTKVADISPLSGVTDLKTLVLIHTQVADITPLAGASGLQVLYLDNSRVRDLRVLAEQHSLIPDEDAPSFFGLQFAGTPATELDAELNRLAAVENARERTDKTLAYLRSLPPLPEPLPWRAPETVAPPPLPDPPEVFGLPEVRVTAEGIDVAPGTATEADLADPIKSQLYTQLSGFAEALFQKGNRYPELSDPARALRELTSGPFEAASILGIHLQLSALDDIRKEDANRPEAEQMDPDCRLAVGQVLRHGPGITMGHPDVVLVEARNAEFAGQPVPEVEAESERRLARTVAEAQVPASDGAQQMAGALATSQSKGRLSQARTVFVQALVAGAGILVAGGLGQAGADGYQWAAEWISANKDAIWTAAQGWGSAFVSWVRDLLTTVLRPKGPGGTLL